MANSNRPTSVAEPTQEKAQDPTTTDAGEASKPGKLKKWKVNSGIHFSDGISYGPGLPAGPVFLSETNFHMKYVDGKERFELMGDA